MLLLFSFAFYIFIRPLLSRSCHQSERFLYSYNKILKVKRKIKIIYNVAIDTQLKLIKRP